MKMEEIFSPKFICSCGNNMFDVTFQFYSKKDFTTKCPSCGKMYYKNFGNTSILKIDNNYGNTHCTTYKMNKIVVENDGIYKEDKDMMELIMSRETFIEAYNKYIREIN